MNREKMQARKLSPLDLMQALDRYNVFLSAGDAKFGKVDYALGSNSMYLRPKDMGDIPIKTTETGETIFLKHVADPQDASFIQTNIVRVNGRKQVYIPVYRQMGSSTLEVVDKLKKKLPEFKKTLPHEDIDLKLVMDQSVYVRQSIHSLVEEGVLGAVLCSLVILLFLGWSPPPSLVPKYAASLGWTPRPRCRWVFPRQIIAVSTSGPIASLENTH